MENAENTEVKPRRGRPPKNTAPVIPTQNEEKTAGFDCEKAYRDLATRVEKLEKAKETVKESIIPQVVSVEYNKEPDEVPVPQEWRDAISSVLSPSFPAFVRYRPDTNFDLTIIVPKEFSNASKQEIETNGCDRRFRVIPNALGITGVKQYAQLVSENLGRDIMFKVDLDRERLTNK